MVVTKTRESFSLNKKVYEKFRKECRNRKHIISGMVEYYMIQQLKKWGIEFDERELE